MRDSVLPHQCEHRYTYKDKPIIWVYYDRRWPPAHIRLSMASMICMNEPHAQMVAMNNEMYEKYLPNSVDMTMFMRMSGNHKADYYRAHILGELL